MHSVISLQGFLVLFPRRYSKHCGSRAESNHLGWKQNWQQWAPLGPFQSSILWLECKSHKTSLGNPRRQCKVFKQMHQEGVITGWGTYFCSSPECMCKIRSTWRRESQTDISTRFWTLINFVGSNLLGKYVKCGSIKVALSVAERSTLCSNGEMFTWNSIIEGCQRMWNADYVRMAITTLLENATERVAAPPCHLCCVAECIMLVQCGMFW